MAVILAHPTASAITARRPRRAVRDIPFPSPGPRSPAGAPRRTRSLLLLGLMPLLLANASWDAVTFFGGTGVGGMGAPALPGVHASASACA